MLTGEYRHSVDAKKRIFIPAKHREELGTSFIIAKDLRGPRLKIFSLSGWEEYIAPIRKMERKTAEAILRALHKDAISAEPDSQGRVVLSQVLMDHAHITKDAVIVGCYDCAEIWSAEEYEAETATEDIDALREELEKLGL